MADKTKKKVKMVIDKERCKGCLFCIEVCPQKILEVSEGINKRGVRYVVMRDPDKCTGCGLCVLMCPDCAIEIFGD
ncbi:MAG: ferredoxin family protein [Candidatus Omnitrophota bacterium]|nr:ferredoxin family protein [Candidatus Omnitrophota bacterium]